MATNDQLALDVQELRLNTATQEQKIQTHEQRLSIAESEISKLKEENKAIYEINTNVRILAENMTSVKSDMKDVKEDVKGVKSNQTTHNQKINDEIVSLKQEINTVKNQPQQTKAEWWDKIIWIVVGGGVTAVVAAVIEHISK